MDETLLLVKVLVVEDSITTRKFLVNLINSMPGMMVCGEAYNGVEALRLTEQIRPNVISMDIQLPRMDGLEATRQIMAFVPTPIVVVSSGVGQKEVDVAMQAMEAGALAAIETPTAKPQDEAKRMEFLRLLRLMSGVRVIRRNTSPFTLTEPVTVSPNHRTQPEIVIIGASAGGPGALAKILSELPTDYPLPIILVQHLAAEFISGFAAWLDTRSALPVRLALEGRRPTPGEVWVAPGDYHITLNANRRIMLHSEKAGYRHQPSIDVLLESVASVYGPRAIGILLTGMGKDGAQGMTFLRTNGGCTIAQDEHTSVVFGMPRAAIDQDGVEYVLPLHQIASVLTELVHR